MGQVVSSWKALGELLNTVREEGKRIISTNGVFDVLHVGHVRYLQQARSLGDVLVVGVNSDSCTSRLKGPLRPFVCEAERMEMLTALSCVDYVVLFDEPTPEALLEVIKPALHAKGGDYHADLLPETAVVRKHGGEVVVLPFVPKHSTTELAERIATIMIERT